MSLLFSEENATVRGDLESPFKNCQGVSLICQSESARKKADSSWL